MGGMVFLNLLELGVFGIDYYFYRNDKIHKYLYCLDRFLMLVAFNTVGFVKSLTSLRAVLGLSLYIIFAIKVYYCIKAYI